MSNTANMTWSGGLVPLRFETLKGGQVEKCGGSHYIYVAEVVAVEREGKIVVVNVCRACGQVTFTEKQIAQPNSPLTFTKEKEQENVL